MLRAEARRRPVRLVGTAGPTAERCPIRAARPRPAIAGDARWACAVRNRDPKLSRVSRLLFVTQQLPWPRTSGGNIRTHAMLAALARRFDVVLCSTGADAPGEADARDELDRLGVDARLVRESKRRSRVAQARGVLASLWRGSPAVLVHNEEPALAAAVDEALAAGVDGVHLNHLDTTPYVDLDTAPPTVVDTHNVLFDYYARRAEHESRAAVAWVLRREARLLRKLERDAFARAGRVVVCSDDERALLAELDPRIRAAVVPNGVDADALRPAEDPPTGADLVFVGDMAYGPNRDGALWFAREVLPLVREREPAARFMIVGKNPSPDLERLAREHDEVVATGFVDSVAPWVHAARAVVIPIRYGSGTRLKALEAFACGKAVVATRVGVEGIDCADGEHLLVRDTPRDTAEAVLRLFADRALADRLGANARRLAQARYDWGDLGERMAHVHAELQADLRAERADAAAP